MSYERLEMRDEIGDRSFFFADFNGMQSSIVMINA